MTVQMRNRGHLCPDRQVSDLQPLARPQMQDGESDKMSLAYSDHAYVHPSCRCFLVFSPYSHATAEVLPYPTRTMSPPPKGWFPKRCWFPFRRVFLTASYLGLPVCT